MSTREDSSTLDGVRYVLTEKNKTNRPRTTGSLTPETEVICLRRSESGYYVPCVAYIVSVSPSQRFLTVDLYEDRSERVTVSLKAILWPNGYNSDQKQLCDDYNQQRAITTTSK